MYLKFKKIKSYEVFQNSVKLLIELEDSKDYVFSIDKKKSLDLSLILKAQKKEIELECLVNSDEIVFLIDSSSSKKNRSEIEEDFFALDFVETYLTNINKRKKPKKLGFKTIDEAIGGLWMGKTYLIGAPSGHAKTIMLINLCKKVSIDLGISSSYIDLELGRQRLMDRFSGILARFNVRKEAGQMDSYKKNVLSRALKEKNLKNILVSDLSQRRVYFKELEKNMKNSLEKGVKVFFIDYVQNISSNKSLDKKEDLAEISYALRLFANKHEVSIFMATQLNRGSSVCDIFEFNQDRVSDSIELVRDRDFMINIRKFQSDKEHHKGILECFIAKNREGEQKKFYLKFKEWTGLLEECNEPSELSEEEAQNIKAPPSFFEEEIPNKFKD